MDERKSVAEAITDFLGELLDFIIGIFTRKKTRKEKMKQKLDEEEYWPRDKFERESYARLKKKESEL